METMCTCTENVMPIVVVGAYELHEDSEEGMSNSH